MDCADHLTPKLHGLSPTCMVGSKLVRALFIASKSKGAQVHQPQHYTWNTQSCIIFGIHTINFAAGVASVLPEVVSQWDYRLIQVLFLPLASMQDDAPRIMVVAGYGSHAWIFQSTPTPTMHHQD